MSAVKRPVVVASAEVIDHRLQSRLADGGLVAQQLVSQFQRGQLEPSIFEPPACVDASIEIDTSDGGATVVDAVEAAFIALLR